MASKVFLPKLGQTMEEGSIVEWHKKEGDPVARGDVLFEVESDKAVLEVEAKAKGVLLKILLEAGVKVPVLTVAAIIGKEDEDISALLAEAADGPSAPVATAAPTPAQEIEPVTVAPTPALVPVAGRERIFSSPRARKIASEKGVDLQYVAGSGPNGRIVEKDVLAFIQAQPAATPLARKMAQELGVSLDQVPAGATRVTSAQVQSQVTARAVAPVIITPAEGDLTPMRGVRAIIADRMSTSNVTTAPVTIQNTVDATELVALRTKLKEAFAKELGFNIGFNDILAVIAARCLVEYPYMNVRLEEGGIRQLPQVNVGLAVDSERGLLVPVIHNASSMSVKELAVTFRELVGRAREGKSLPDDLSGGTFTITNLGMFDVDMFSPIINLPECAILGVGRIRLEPTVFNGEIAIRQKMWLSLTFDHRLVDGAPAARFLQAMMRYIEEPYLLLA